MAQNPGVAGPFFYTGTVTADAAAVSLLSLMSGFASSNPIASLYFVSNVILYLGTADSPPTAATTTWTLPGTTPFIDAASGVPSDLGPSLSQLMVFTTGAGSAVVQIYVRTR